MKTRSRQTRKAWCESLESRRLLTGMFQGQVWHDANHDGLRSGNRDYELADITVNLWDETGRLYASQATNDAGRYEFRDVAVGKYTVQFELPEGTVFSPDNSEDDNSVDSDVLTLDGRTKQYKLKDGEIQNNVDAGIYGLFASSSVRGMVFEDSNGNGIFEPDESTISGAEVQIENIYFNKLFDVKSQADGTFLFEGQHLMPGEYVLDFVRPTLPDLPEDAPEIRLSVSPIPVGIDDPDITNFASSDNGKTSPFTVVAGHLNNEPNDVILNGSFYIPTSIIGNVFHDFNRDGTQRGRTEFGLNGIEVKLLGANQHEVASTYSGKGGGFSFRSLPIGQYFVQYGHGHDLSPIHPSRTDRIQLMSGRIVELEDYGLYSDHGTSSIAGFVWNDLNSDGLFTDNEPKRPGHTVRLQNIGFKTLFQIETDDEGNYFFDGAELPPGEYIVSFAEEDDISADTNLRISPRNIHAHLTSRFDNDIQPTNGNTQVLSLKAHEEGVERTITNLDAAFFELGTVSGFAWQDSNLNGIHENQERPLSDVEIRLLDSDGEQIDRTFTVDGKYTFESVYPNDYQVAIEVANGVQFTSPRIAQARSDVFAVKSNDSITINAGLIGTSLDTSLTGLIWDDRNGDGIRSTGETGRRNVVVRLLSPTGRQVRIAVSDDQGRYEFEDIDPSEYSVSIDVPLNSTISPFRSGSNSAIDSDINRWNGRTPYFPIVDGQMMESIDVGIYSGPISTDSVNSIRVTEIGFIGHGNPEFTEIKNIGDLPVDLSDVSFTQGVVFDFADSVPKSIFPGELAIVIGDKQRLTNEYNLDEVNVAGEYDNDLGRNETLSLRKGQYQVITEFEYNHEWFIIMDSEFLPWTLTVVDEDADVTEWNRASNWRPSSKLAGTPGINDPNSKELPNPGTIVVNEVLPKSSDGRNDLIEIHNRGDQDFDIGNWYIGDSERELEPLVYLTRYRIAPGTIIPAGGFKVFSREEHFGNPDDPGVNFPFGLSSFGEAVHLIAADEFGRMQGYSDSVSFDGSRVDVSFGRLTPDGNDLFTAMTKSTFGEPNDVAPIIESIIIDQVMYNAVEKENEYVRLKNISDKAIDLSIGFQPWRLSSGIKFVFEDDALIQSGQHFFVVNDDPDEFRRRLNVPSHVQIFGPYENSLSDSNDDIRLFQYMDDGRKVSVDHVSYRNHAPWPFEADFGNVPITRISTERIGNDPTNWRADDLAKVGHFEENLFIRKFATITDNIWFEASYAGLEFFQASPGDSNGDGKFDSRDLVQVFQNAKYDTDAYATWNDGDWDGNGRFDSKDLVLAFQNDAYISAATDFISKVSAALAGVGHNRSSASSW